MRQLLLFVYCYIRLSLPEVCVLSMQAAPWLVPMSALLFYGDLIIKMFFTTILTLMLILEGQ